MIAASPLATSLDDRYLDFSNLSNRLPSDLRPKETLQALHEFLVAIKLESLDKFTLRFSEDGHEIAFEVSEEPETILRKLRVFSDHQLGPAWVYNNLIKLANDAYHCETITSTVLLIAYLLRDKENGLSPLVPFLKCYGNMKFGGCSETQLVTRKFEKHPDNDFEKALD